MRSSQNSSQSSSQSKLEQNVTTEEIVDESYRNFMCNYVGLYFTLCKSYRESPGNKAKHQIELAAYRTGLSSQKPTDDQLDDIARKVITEISEIKPFYVKSVLLYIFNLRQYAEDAENLKSRMNIVNILSNTQESNLRKILNGIASQFIYDFKHTKAYQEKISELKKQEQKALAHLDECVAVRLGVSGANANLADIIVNLAKLSVDHYINEANRERKLDYLILDGKKELQPLKGEYDANNEPPVQYQDTYGQWVYDTLLKSFTGNKSLQSFKEQGLEQLVAGKASSPIQSIVIPMNSLTTISPARAPLYPIQQGIFRNVETNESPSSKKSEDFKEEPKGSPVGYGLFQKQDDKRQEIEQTEDKETQHRYKLNSKNHQ